MLESVGFGPLVAMLDVPGGDTESTLQAALAQTDRNDRPNRETLFERHDATVPDLWLGRASETSRPAIADEGEALAPLRKLGPGELALIAGGSGSDSNGDDYPWEWSNPTVWGPAPYYDWNFPSNDPGDQYPGGTGGGGSDPSPDLPHDKTCSSEDGAAKQIADAIKAAPAVTGRGDWTQIEMGTFVVRTPDGRYGALESTIYTDNQYNGVTIPNVWGDDYVVGIVHNHPDSLGGDQTDLINRYPSAGDWAGLEVLYNAYSPHYPGYDPSIWIMDSEGDLREFKFSERGAIESLTEAQKTAGQGLEGRERTSSCS